MLPQAIQKLNTFKDKFSYHKPKPAWTTFVHLELFILSITKHSCSQASKKAQLSLCPTLLMPSALILSLPREKEFVNFGFILKLPN